MNLKKVVMNLRVKKELKGKYPVVVFIINNQGDVINSKKGYFVLTYTDKELWFHSITKYLNRHIKENDFGIDLSKFEHYTLESLSSRSMKLSIISYKGDYLPLGYFTHIPDSAQGEHNMCYIIDELKRLGITETNLLESDIKKQTKKPKEKEEPLKEEALSDKE